MSLWGRSEKIRSYSEWRGVRERTRSKVGGKSDKDGIDSRTTGRAECDEGENDVRDKAE